MNTNKTYAPSKGLGGLIEEIFQHSLTPWTQEAAANCSLHKVPVNILETEQEYRLQVIAPGLTREDFNIAIEKNLMTISVNQESKNEEQTEKWLRQEYIMRSFKRSFTLTDKVDTSNIKAKYADGILTIYIAKQTPATPQTIKIDVA